MEESQGRRISGVRLEQARETGAGAVAAGCPFCITMFEDGGRRTADGRTATADGGRRTAS